MMRVIELTVWGILLASVPATAQTRPQTPPPPPPGVTPQPVGRGSETTPATGTATQAPSPRPQTAAPASQAPAGRPATTPSSPAGGAATTRDAAASPIIPAETAPTEAELGVPVFPGARFLRSYDAGQGQRDYLYGATASFGELVLYYRNQLKKSGDLVYDEPPVHRFEVGRFREETMAFPPGVTVKDYTWGGGKGYLVPTPGANPSRFPTIIQIVTVTAANR